METTIIVFRNDGKILETGKWMYNAQYLEVVNTLNTLGCYSIITATFFQTQKRVAQLGRKALFVISNTLKNHYFNVET
jgi:hypothetical protein